MVSPRPIDTKAVAGRTLYLGGYHGGLFLKPLGKTIIYLYTPRITETTPKPKSNDPSLIIICAWMGAGLRPVSSYIYQYNKRYPQSQILILFSSLVDVGFTPYWIQRRHLEPAATFLRTLAPTDTVLAHVFSNGGVNTFLQLGFALGGPIPGLKGIFFDSAPGQTHFLRDPHPIITAFGANAVLKPVVTAFVWTFVALMHGSFWVKKLAGFDKEDVFMRHARWLMEDEVVGKGVKRQFVYSETDEMVWYKDVEEHIAKEKEADLEVRVDKFEGSRHVAHAKGEPERYWKVVDDFWRWCIDG
ncbi:hypothetical protein BJ508DRAFT_419920 [Ascobolus immersus RN42]|uniref:DUF829-domain-containing protein n=1 Tax=Ascobolus immersus RN42 TaxID=1160509 RepID=A0A3N4HA39_ASCIM|nr:hypothetical protein BJ508DRAFT_419920 [Ascobolus immersus RN42]